MDFTNLPHRQKCYAGANGSKLSVVLDGKQYMLKFPPTPSINKDMSYTNSCFSEYLGSHIFELLGIPVQETLLGTYEVQGKTKIVVACRDFTSPGVVLQDFASLKNTIIDSAHNGYGPDLADIEQAMEDQRAIDSEILKDRFWDTFVADALTGNWDRHNGNWGFLYDSVNDTMTLAPVYDNGSCLYPQADPDIMRSVLENRENRDARIYQVPLSGIKIGGQKINYFNFLSSLENADCNAALKRIVPRMDLKVMCDMVDKTPYLTDLQREFYKTMLSERKTKILDYAYQKLLKRERSKKRNDRDER